MLFLTVVTAILMVYVAAVVYICWVTKDPPMPAKITMLRVNRPRTLVEEAEEIMNLYHKVK
jgi:hypothetical protein